MGSRNPTSRGVARLRAAFLVRTFDVGGSERQLVALTRGLLERGHDALVAVVEGGGTMVPDLHHAGVSVYEVTERGIRGFPLRAPQLVRTLRRWRPDVLHSYLPYANALAPWLRPFLAGGGAAKGGLPVVLGVRVIAPERAPDDPRVRALYRAEAFAARRADAVIANSDAARADVVARGFPDDRMHVIPNGIDTDRFRFDPEGRARLRKEWSIGADDVLVGRVGRMRPNKDYEAFLHAAAEAGSRCERLRFVCIGDGPQRVELEALGRSLALDGRLVWTGVLDDMAAAMSSLDLLVSSSRVESFPNVIAEAMACGVPCVVTDAGDSAVIVGDTGTVVPPESPDALRDGILDRVEEHAHESAAARARRSRIEQEFGLDAMVDRTEQLLQDLVAARRR